MDEEEEGLVVRVPKDRLPPPDVVSPLSSFAAALHAIRGEEEDGEGMDEEEADPHAMDSASVDDSDEDDEDGGGKMPQLKTAAESFFSDL